MPSSHKRKRSDSSTIYTASTAFFEALWETGVRACFVNLGSDHVSIIEAMLEAQKDRNSRFPKIYTCPNEMVALSMADGWARVTGQPQAVIVHVDVGTQSPGAAIHNASVGRCPALIFAGLSPYTEVGELGSRNEYQMWLQDVPDQKAIVSQYCRYVGEFRTAATVKQTVARAMQFAKSDPKGPVYLVGAREVMAEVMEPYVIDIKQWVPISVMALPQQAVTTVAEALVYAKSPLIITGYSGRNHACPKQLVRLADLIPGLRILDTGGSDMCFPFSHRASLGFSLDTGTSLSEFDIILILDCDVPWIPSGNPPPKDARVYSIGVDPLNRNINLSFYPALGKWQADSYTAITQIIEGIHGSPALENVLKDPVYEARWDVLAQEHAARLANLAALAKSLANKTFDENFIAAVIKQSVPEDTVFVMEAVTLPVNIANQLQVDLPGHWINCGGTGLGWSGSAALGVKLAHSENGTPKFICQIVGDGAYMFSIPSGVYWTASRYGIPILTVVLNNSGWNAPRDSVELVYTKGEAARLASQATNKQMHISFDPSPDYGGIAKAAAGKVFGQSGVDLYTGKASTPKELRIVIAEAVKAVKEGRGAVVEAVMQEEVLGLS